MAKRKMPKEALEFFRKAGARGGKARLTKLSPAKRSEVAKKAAAARWGRRRAEGRWAKPAQSASG
jgi:hypothetical protein